MPLRSTLERCGWRHPAREVEDDDEDDQEDEYRVFGRQTMKAQSEALYEAGIPSWDTLVHFSAQRQHFWCVG